MIRNFILSNFPFLEDDFDALTDYQLFCKMLDYVRKVHIDNERFINQITVKLEQMYNEGKFDSLIEEIVNLQLIFVYNTVSDMKSATNLVNGSHCKTLGYSSINDGGESYYLIRNKEVSDTTDDMFIIELSDDTLVAELLIKNKLNVNQVGIFGDSTTDVSNKLNYVLARNINEIFLPKGTYIISKQIVYGNSDMKLIGENINNTTIKIQDNLDSESYTSYIASTSKNNIEFGNIKINAGTQILSKFVLSLIQGNNINVHDVEIYGGYGYATRFNDTTNLNVSNVYVHDIYDFPQVAGGVYGMNMQKARFEHIRGKKLGDHLIYITGDNDGICSDIYINDVYGDEIGIDELTNGSAITLYGNTYNVTISNVIIENSTQTLNITEHGETAQCPHDIVVTNVVSKNNKNDGFTIRGKETALVDNLIFTNINLDTCGQDGFGIRYGSNITLNNNIIKNITRYGIDYQNSNSIMIQNNSFVNTGVSIRSAQYNNDSLISNNNGSVSLDTSITCNYGLIINGTSTNHKAYNNYFNGFALSNYLIRGETNKVLFESNNNSTTSDETRSIYFGTSVGSAIDSQKGDIVINTNPTAGGSAGWICTTAGTPGTWKEFGSISS